MLRGQEDPGTMVPCHDCRGEVYIGAIQSDRTPARPDDHGAGYVVDVYFVSKLLLCALCALRRDLNLDSVPAGQ